MEKIKTGSNLPINHSINKVDAQLLSHSAPQGIDAPLGLDTSIYCLWKGCGVIHLNINCGAINASSLVQISMSEYGDVNNPAGSRFVGAARYAIYNISPRDGGVVIWAEVSWAAPINIYFSILVA